MDYTAVIQTLNDFGLLFVLVFSILEYLNLPGLPATPILMAMGIWGHAHNVLILTTIVSIIGAQIGTVILYWIGRFFGHVLMDKYYRRFPKHEEKIQKYVSKIGDEGPHILFIVRLIPLFRTLITIPSGLVKIDFRHFFWYSLLGITVWNSIFILAGSGAYDIVYTLYK